MGVAVARALTLGLFPDPGFLLLPVPGTIPVVTETQRRQRNQEEDIQGKEEFVRVKDQNRGQCSRYVGAQGGKAGPDLTGPHGPQEGDSMSFQVQRKPPQVFKLM